MSATMSQIGYHPLNFRAEADTNRRRSASSRVTRFRITGNRNETRKTHWESYTRRHPDYQVVVPSRFPHVSLRKIPQGWELEVKHDASHPMNGSVMRFKTKREAMAVARLYETEFKRPVSVKTGTGVYTKHYHYTPSSRN